MNTRLLSGSHIFIAKKRHKSKTNKYKEFCDSQLLTKQLKYYVELCNGNTNDRVRGMQTDTEVF
jgi:hypothetical protein